MLKDMNRHELEKLTKDQLIDMILNTVGGPSLRTRFIEAPARTEDIIIPPPPQFRDPVPQMNRHQLRNYGREHNLIEF